MKIVFSYFHGQKIQSLSFLNLLVGDWDQDVEDVDEQELSIASVHFHPEFNIGAYLNNDLAVVRVKTEVRLTSRVMAVCLPSPSTSYSPGTQTTISGQRVSRKYDTDIISCRMGQHRPGQWRLLPEAAVGLCPDPGDGQVHGETGVRP